MFDPFEKVFAAVNAIAAMDLEMELLKERVKEARSELPEIIAASLENVPEKDAIEPLNKIYWSNPHKIARAIKRAYQIQYHRWFFPKPVQVESTCNSCGLPGTVECSSLDQFNDVMAHGFYWTICPNCPKTKSGAKEHPSWIAHKERVEQLRALPYKEYLKSDHWQEVRIHSLRRAGFRCQLCNAQARLNVHHRTYENLGEERPNDVIALCEACHERHHGIKKDGAK